ncbi:MAG: 50S ribosomal protein L10 [Cycloclasticus sp. symbiont of Bathymodiolus heckerae]|nr:MAG: 50S ribosomal protein L10 [Cycloclasticus sp. symbiont of Bathymodiolus heckerae]
MPLNLEKKQAVVAEVAEVAASAFSAVAAQYRGLTVGEMTELREKARESGVYLRVVKNTLVRKAVENTEFECIQDALKGPLVMAFSMEDPGSAARLVKDFSKDHEKLETQFVSIGGQLLDASELVRLSKLPTKDQAISMLMSVMKAPVEKFVRTLAEPHSQLVRVVDAVRVQKQAA